MQSFCQKKLWNVGYKILCNKQHQGIFYRSIQPETVPEHPKKSLFSSAIEQDLSPEQSMQLAKEHSIAFGSKDTQNELRPFQKLANFELAKSDYSQINARNPNGKVNIFTYKNTKFTLVGSQYEFIPPKKFVQNLVILEAICYCFTNETRSDLKEYRH